MSFKDKPCWFGGSSSTHQVTCGFGNVSWKRSKYFDKISSRDPQVCLAFTFGSMCVPCFLHWSWILHLFLEIHSWLPSCLILVSSKPQFPINLGVCGCAQLHWPRKNYFKIDHCQDNCRRLPISKWTNHRNTFMKRDILPSEKQAGVRKR